MKSDKLLEFIKDFFDQIKEIEVTEVFSINENNIIGKILYKTSKDTLSFNVEVPLLYPVSNISFYCLDLIGYEHMGCDGKLCLNSLPYSDLNDKLNFEVSQLIDWVETFYVRDEKSQHYEYPLFCKNFDYVPSLFFKEDLNDFTEDRFKDNFFGNFKYFELNAITLLCNELGNSKFKWKDHFWNFKKEIFLGIWVYIKKEPVKQRKERITNWTELKTLLPEGFQDFFYKHCADFPKDFLYDQKYYFLMIGYDIPNDTGFEINWDLIRIPTDDFTRQNAQDNKLNLEVYNKDILWGNTSNVSYERFFGRGKLSDNLTEKKILIIGVGAIGSNLANILVRGGCKFIYLTDYDVIEAGNICRAYFPFNLVSFTKAEALKLLLDNISPFVDIKVINKADWANYVFKEGDLLDFDIIFDCTADMDLSTLLDEKDINDRIINLSITENSKELVCTAGVGSISNKKTAIFRKLNAVYKRESTFFPGTGCWHPTFRASFADISMLLNFAINEINYRSLNKIEIKSFILKYIQESLDIKIELINDP